MNGLFLKKSFILSGLTGISLVLYLIDYRILGNSSRIVSSFLENLAFLPIYILLITLIVEQIVKAQERQAVMRKLNMVIGVFFSEVGNRLLKELAAYVVVGAELKRHLQVTTAWKEGEFAQAVEFLQQADIRINCSVCDKSRLKEFLLERRSFLAGLLENQNLLEHDQFTDLLWSVFHLLEELEARSTFDDMPTSDIEHLNGDIKRVFGHLSREWLLYLQHLRTDYPYLYSLAVRLNPMIDNPDPRVY